MVDSHTAQLNDRDRIRVVSQARGFAMSRFTVCAVAAGCVVALALGCDASKPPEAAGCGTEPAPKPGESPSSEMKLLEDMIGTWDDVSTNNPSEWVPKAGTSRAVTTRAW